MKDAILDAAERRARRGGYNGFSFRELAEDVGIKSASVHYHFPTKEDLAAALAERYADKVAAQLGPPARLPPRAAIKLLAEIFITANEAGDQMCLCGIFAAESDSLPSPLLPKVAAFFDMVVRWLDVALKPATGAPKAVEIVAALEGAMLMSRIRRDPAILRTVAAALVKRVPA